jgi:large subunit ribosomal protein L3
MIDTLLAIKKEMTSSYDARGRRVGATVLSIEPNFVTQVKAKDTKDGYNAVQISMGSKKSVKSPQVGHFKKAGLEQKFAYVKEVRTERKESLELGEEIKVNKVFRKGDAVKVTGTSKGKGFQGGVRRHGFHGGPKTHGQSDRHRAPGSSGTGTTPGRVLKGKRMAGHMGVETVSTKGLEVIAVDKTNNLITIKGAIPGPTGGLVIIQNIGKIKGYTPPPEEKEEDEEAPSDVEQMKAGDGAPEEASKEEKPAEQAAPEVKGEENG